MKRAENAFEVLDGTVAAPERAASLADIDRLNSWFGGYALSLRAIRALAAEVPRDRPLRVVDVGGGTAAFAMRVAEWARRSGRDVRVVVVDRDLTALRLARAAVAAYPEIVLVGGDAGALPCRKRAADIVTSALTLHHLEPVQAAAGLREMTAAARIAVVVNDLLRRRLSLGLVWLATRLLGCHPISRHDGPLSVRRSYSRDELTALAEKAGARRLTIREYPVLGRLLAVLS
ncbi:MAG TPA: methyltransferase domain-containing protein [Methylomirabilota bacterium]|nr:methyltransferase domain-containing protein [Methylomirabilota bacterium]